VFTQNLPRAYLPPIARTVMPVDMIITRASIPAGPGHFGGKYVLTDTHDGNQLRLAMLFDAEEAFTADWISKHH
jgi:hypothetical protein